MVQMIDHAFEADLSGPGQGFIQELMVSIKSIDLFQRHSRNIVTRSFDFGVSRLLEVSLLRIWQFYSLMTRNIIARPKPAQLWSCQQGSVK